MLQLPKLYAITDVVTSGFSHVEQVRLLAEGGAKLIQLREKQASGRDFYEQASLAIGLARDLGVTIIINDRVDIAALVGAAGAHLGQDDLPVKSARSLLGSDQFLGLSTHNLRQAEAALKVKPDYIAVGPIFTTSNKKNPAPVLGLAGLREIKRVTEAVPLVAIGGINQENAGEVLSAGADSVAIIGALLAGPRGIRENTQAMLAALP